MPQETGSGLAHLFESSKARLVSFVEPLAERVKPQIASTKASFEHILWENHRKPQLLKQFERRGFEEPEKAVAVVKFLEIHMQEDVHARVGSWRRGAWHYQSEDIESIRELSQGVEEPVQTLGNLSQLIDFSEGHYLSKFAKYFSRVKDNPRFPQVLEKLQVLRGRVSKMNIRDVILQEDGQVVFNAYTAPDYRSDVRLPDFFSQLSNLSEDEFENLMSEENIARLVSLSEEIHRESKDSQMNNVHSGHLVDLLQVAADETKAQMLIDSLATNHMYFAVDRTLGKAAKRMLDLTEKVPQLAELYQMGFDVDDHLHFREQVSVDAEVASWGNYQEKFDQILHNQRLCDNARLMKKFDLRKSEMQTTDADHNDFWRDMETATLEKLLTVMCSILPEDMQSKRFEIYNMWQFSSLKEIDWDKIPTADLQGAMVLLPPSGPERMIFERMVRPLLAKYTDGQELKRKVEIASRPEFQEAIRHENFLNAMGATRHGMNGADAVIIQALVEPEEFLRLWNSREQFIQRCNKLSSNLSWETDQETLVALNDLSDSDLNKFIALIERRTLKPDLMKKAKVILNMDEEEIKTMNEDLGKRRIEGVLDPILKHDELVAIYSLPKERRAEFFVVLDHVLENKGMLLIDTGNDLIALSIFFYRHPDARAVFESMMLKHRRAAVMLIDDKWAKSDFEFSQYFDEVGNVKPPLIEYLYAKRDVSVCLDLLNNAVIETMPVKDKKFWTFARKYGTMPALGEYLISVRPDFDKVCPEGVPTETYLVGAIEAGLSGYPQNLLNDKDLNSFFTSFPEQNKSFWRYYATQNLDTKTSFVFEHREEFAKLIVDGQETTFFWELLSREQPRFFVQNATREQWRMVFGEEVNKFLAVLPTRTDEKRNAFTHNEYDRTSKFTSFLMSHAETDFQLSPQDFSVMTEFVARFGLAENALIFRYFKHLYLHEYNRIELPEDIVKSGITSSEELQTQLARIRTLAYRVEPITDAHLFTPFEVQMLDVITGKSTHTFSAGRPGIDQIVTDFQTSYREGKVTPIPDGYRADTIDLFNARIEFDATAVKTDFELFQREILAGIDDPENVTSLKTELNVMIDRKITQMQEVLPTATGPKATGISRGLQQFVNFQNGLSTTANPDDLMLLLLSQNLSVDGEDKRLLQSVERQIVLRKVFIKHYPPEKTERLKILLQNEISGEAVLAVTDLVNELAKTHALNLTKNNEENYWRSDVFEKMKILKQGKDLPLLFNPAIERLKKETDKFKTVQIGDLKKLQIIPDHGLIGEMSGYLANVCYTKEYPFLSRWQNVVPYKFISQDENGAAQFVGSVLVFEIEDANGAKCMLVRAFDIPEENKYDTGFLIEQFIGKMEGVAKTRGVKRILVPGNEQAMSNYTMTKNHMLRNYVTGKTAISLKQEFNFNGYDLTKNCYVAREIEGNK